MYSLKDPSPPPNVTPGRNLKERKKFSKLLIFSTDCSQSMGLQSVIKIRSKTSKLFALHASPYKGRIHPGVDPCSTKDSTWYVPAARAGFAFASLLEYNRLDRRLTNS
jgi:hypothetical protein